MNCSSCQDKGIIRLNWADAPQDYALCLCKVGLDIRSDDNNGKRGTPLYVVWCAREQIDPSRVCLMEDILTAEELAERGFSRPVASLSREAALLATGRKQKGQR